MTHRCSFSKISQQKQNQNKCRVRQPGKIRRPEPLFAGRTRHMEKIPMTPQGFQALEAELIRLKNQDRHEVIKAIAEARAHGDLSENAEYHAAKERQSFIEGRVLELEDQMGRADVIDISKLSGTSVKFGATVTLVDEDTDEMRKYLIEGDVGSGG